MTELKLHSLESLIAYLAWLEAERSEVRDLIRVAKKHAGRHRATPLFDGLTEPAEPADPAAVAPKEA